MQWWTSRLTWAIGMPVAAALVAILCVVQQQAQSLAHFEFGRDGYFPLYDASGRSLVSPRQPELAGRNLWDWHDPDGQPTVQRLLAVSAGGGGTLRYPWQRPSSGHVAPKLGDVEPIADYGPTIGTGLHLDDIERGLAEIDAQARASIRRTSVLIVAIAAGCVLGIGLLACALHQHERRDSRQRLRRVARRAVETRDDERQRLAGELHDGIGQVLVSAKLLVETAADTGRDPPASPPAEDVLPRAVDRLNLALVEMRRISRGLHPAALEHGTLPAALRRLLHDFGGDAGLAVHAELPAACRLPPAVEATLFRVAQEALANVARHARARRVELALRCAPREVGLRIADDGRGFDPAAGAAGLGLRSLRERAAALGGRLAIRSGPAGTALMLEVPLPAADGAPDAAPASRSAVPSANPTPEVSACPIP